MRASLQQHARHHDLVADHHLAIEQRIQLLALDILPSKVFHFAGCAHFITPYSRAALSCKYIRASSIALASLNAPSATSSAKAAEIAVRADRTASQKVSSAPIASLNGNASDPNIMRSGNSETHCFRIRFSSDG